MMKGAPEAILGKCKKARVNRDVVDIDDVFRQECQVRVAVKCTVAGTLLLAFFTLLPHFSNRESHISLLAPMCPVQNAWESLGNAGRRVIAFAQAHFNAPMSAKFGAGEDRWPEDLVFLGMAAIMDPPRLVVSRNAFSNNSAEPHKAN